MSHGRLSDVWVAPLILVVFVAFVVGYLKMDESAAYEYALKREDYNTIFIDLFLIALVVERFIEVFNSIWRRAGKVRCLRKVHNARTERERIDAQLHLDAYRSRTETLAMYGSFLMGLAVALSGVHILQVLFDISSLPAVQQTLFKATDIVLTAGLIAGGSKGINGLTSLFGNFLARSKDNIMLLDAGANAPRDSGERSAQDSSSGQGPGTELDNR